MKKRLVTERELEVLRLIAQGFRAHEIAKRLFLSPHTIRDHRRSLLRKLDARNAANMISISFSLGLLSS